MAQLTIEEVEYGLDQEHECQRALLQQVKDLLTSVDYGRTRLSPTMSSSSLASPSTPPADARRWRASRLLTAPHRLGFFAAAVIARNIGSSIEQLVLSICSTACTYRHRATTSLRRIDPRCTATSGLHSPVKATGVLGDLGSVDRASRFVATL